MYDAVTRGRRRQPLPEAMRERVRWWRCRGGGSGGVGVEAVAVGVEAVAVSGVENWPRPLPEGIRNRPRPIGTLTTGCAPG